VDKRCGQAVTCVNLRDPASCHIYGLEIVTVASAKPVDFEPCRSPLYLLHPQSMEAAYE
jgi:hypothetical protein